MWSRVNAWFDSMDQTRRILLVRLQTSHTSPPRMESDAIRTHTTDHPRQYCPMAIVVVYLAMPFAQIYNMAETRSERTDRGISYPVERCRIVVYYEPLKRAHRTSPCRRFVYLQLEYRKAKAER